LVIYTIVLKEGSFTRHMYTRMSLEKNPTQRWNRVWNLYWSIFTCIQVWVWWHRL